MEVQKLLAKHYKFVFEGLRFPVFYGDIMPTSFLPNGKETILKWDRYRRSHGLKYKPYDYNENHEKWFYQNESSYIFEIKNLLKRIPGEKVGVLVIPPSKSKEDNMTMEIVRTALYKMHDNRFINLCDNLYRTVDKVESHISNDRNTYSNTTSLYYDIYNLDLDVLVIIDDVITTGNSFRVVNNIVGSHHQNIPIINFAFYRTMAEAGHDNYDEWVDNHLYDWNKNENIKTGPIEGIIFDFDQTLVDTAKRYENEIEDEFNNVGFYYENGKQPNYRDFIKENDGTYLPYKNYDKIFEKRLPFAILTNSSKKRTHLIHQFEAIKQVLYPDFWQFCSGDNVNEDTKEWTFKYHNRSIIDYKTNLPFRHIRDYPLNLFSVPFIENKEDDTTTSYPKPSTKGVIESLEFLKENFEIDNNSRVIGIGNTPEDIIAFKNVGIESVLALWGVPDFAKNYAQQYWGQDYAFNTVEELNDWIDSNKETIDIRTYINHLIKNSDTQDGKETNFVVYKYHNNNDTIIKKSKRSFEVIKSEYNNAELLDKNLGESYADLLILNSIIKDNINYDNIINIYTTLKYFKGKKGWEYLKQLSKVKGVKLTVSRNLDRLYKEEKLNNFDDSDLYPSEYNKLNFEILKEWQDKNLHWPSDILEEE